MHIEADVRLAAAAGGAARYFADMAGIEGAALTHLQNAVINACKEVFARLTKDHPSLDVTLTLSTDRIEVALTSQAELEPGQTKERARTELAGVDRVQYEMQGGVAVMRLTKYIVPTRLRQ